ncbi:MAG: AAA family ATPase [Sphingobacteriales bacterium]|nr:AAA family ATPase [Sphingobacteriales bacterium]
MQELTGVKNLNDFDHLRITAEKDYPNNVPVITWDGSGIAAAGNITAISAAPKVGKTAFSSVLLAGALSLSGIYDGFNEIEVIPNTERKAVIHMDSEQSEYDQQYGVKTILKRLGEDTTPDNLLSYNIRQLSVNDYKQFTDDVCEAAYNEFGGIHSIFIDGGADYITSVNDEEQANTLVESFTHLAIKYHCPVIVVIHLNPNSDKERGHLGSHLQRQCYGLVAIKKDGDTSTAEPKIMRKAGLSDLQPIHFKYSKEKGYHLPVDAPDKPAANIKHLNKIEQVAKDVFSGQTSLRHGEAIKKIAKAALLKEDAGKKWFNTMLLHDWIYKGEDGLYRLNNG